MRLGLRNEAFHKASSPGLYKRNPCSSKLVSGPQIDGDVWLSLICQSAPEGLDAGSPDIASVVAKYLRNGNVPTSDANMQNRAIT
jgi:hypothetical protein